MLNIKYLILSYRYIILSGCKQQNDVIPMNRKKKKENYKK